MEGEMKRSVFLGGVLMACLASLSPAHAQKATEQFIPLGQSPGLSGVHTLIGRIEAVNPPSRTVTLALEEKKETIIVTERTHIWLDRSPLGLSNVKGSLADLIPGRLAEVKLAAPNQQEAEWLKVEVKEP
jgi:hypothetical protein